MMNTMSFQPRRLLAATLLALVLLPALATADPCLIVYPQSETVYHYDVNEYYTVGPGDPLYDPVYDRGGLVLIELNTNEIAFNIYQAPNLTGFVPSTGGLEGYFIDDPVFDLTVDGFNNEPITYVNVLLVFEPTDPTCMTFVVQVDGQLATYYPGLGWYHPLGDLVVQTPTPHGNNYSDTITVNVEWGGCEGFQAWAFSDENFNLRRDGGECFTAFSHDVTVPVEATTWGGIRGAFGR
jgi:hypothetical protein